MCQVDNKKLTSTDAIPKAILSRDIFLRPVLPFLALPSPPHRNSSFPCEKPVLKSKHQVLTLVLKEIKNNSIIRKPPPMCYSFTEKKQKEKLKGGRREGGKERERNKERKVHVMFTAPFQYTTESTLGHQQKRWTEVAAEASMKWVSLEKL